MNSSLESYQCDKTHQKSLPLLVSPKLLRANDCGQIDCAVIAEETIILYEVKRSPRLSCRQKSRLQRSAIFISAITGLPSKIVYLFGA